MKTDIFHRTLGSLVVLLAGALLIGCNRPEEQNIPDPVPDPVDPEPKEWVITGDASSVSAFSATLSGTVNPVGEPGTFQFGVLVSEKEDVDRDESMDLSSKELGSQNQFKVKTDRLKPETRYYFKAYVLYGGVYRYGEVKSFMTSPFDMSVITQKETDVTSRAVTFHGKVSVEKEYAASIEVGFRYATREEDLTSGKDKYTQGEKEEKDAFSKTLDGLKPATTYYYRASATLNDFEVFGEIRSFTTDEEAVPPQEEAIVTIDATDIDSFGVTLVGEAHPTSEMGEVLLGFLISEQEEPDRNNGMDYSTRELDKQNQFKVKVNQLRPETRYYYMAYILYGGIYHYGSILSFETPASLSVTTGSASDITFASAVLSGSATVLTEYPEADLRVGFVYSIFPESLSDESLDGDVLPADFHAVFCDRGADGSFSGTADGLTPNCLYYYRAFAGYDDDSYSKCGEVRTFTSLENPALQEISNWQISYDGRVNHQESDGTVYPLEAFHFKYTGDDYFFISVVTPEAVNYSYDGDIKMFFENQAGLFVSRAKNLGVSVPELSGIFDKSGTSTYFDILIHGNYSAYLIEITEDGTATGRYAKCPCIIVEESPTEGFRRWIGRWRISDGSSSLFIDVTSCEANYLYYVNGWETGSGVSTQMNSSEDWFFARYRREDGTISFYGQDIESFYDKEAGSNADKSFAGRYFVDGSPYIDVEGIDHWYDISHTVIKASSITLVPESFVLNNGTTATYESMRYFEYLYSEQLWYPYNESGVPVFTGRTVSMSGVNTSSAPHAPRAAVPRELTKTRMVLRVHQDKGAPRKAPGSPVKRTGRNNSGS